MNDYTAETIFATDNKEYKVCLSLGIFQKDGVKDFAWNIITWERDINSNSWTLTTRDFPDNMEFVLTRLKTTIIMNIEKSFERDFREFKREIVNNR
jgi:hypothetical protein